MERHACGQPWQCVRALGDVANVESCTGLENEPWPTFVTWYRNGAMMNVDGRILTPVWLQWVYEGYPEHHRIYKHVVDILVPR